MAAKYRKIDPRMWGDEKFMRLIPREKLIAIYAITAQSNRCGLFKFSFGLGSEQTGLDADSYAKGFTKVCDTLGWKYDQSVRVLFIPTWWKYNQPENPKHLKGCLDDLHEVPQTELLTVFATNNEHVPEHSRDTFRIAMGIAMGKGMPYQKQEQEQEQKQEKDLSADADADEPAKPKERKQPSGAHHELIRTFCDGWKARYAIEYKFLPGKDGKHIKWILAAVANDLAEATKIVQSFLADDEPFVSDKSHPIGLLVSNFNKYRVQALPGARSSHVRNGHSKPTAAERGEYPEPARRLPVL